MTAVESATANLGRLGEVMDEDKQRLKDSLLSQLLQKTSAETSLAADLLQANGWDLQAAMDSFHLLQKRSESPKGREIIQGESVLTLHHHPKDPQPAMAEEEDSDDDTSGSSKLARGFSKATENTKVMWSARAHVWKGLNGWSLETPSYTFTLPDLSTFPDSFRRFLEKDLIETSTLRALENSGHLNWWTPLPKLWPLATSGDGNCLLHSASLGMWGFHDRLLILRKALFDILARGSRRHALWRRWRWQQHQTNKASGLLYSEEEWRSEWEALVRLASPQPRSKPNPPSPPLPNSPSAQTSTDVAGTDSLSDRVWESLEEIHVFALAHVLKRPVIVVADTVLRDSGGEAFAPIPFGGIYLPLECPPSECHRSPLVLSYDAAHFSALVLMHSSNSTASSPPMVPLTTDKPRRLLPLHFAADPGPDFTWWADQADHRIAKNTHLDDEQQLALIRRYLDLTRFPSRRLSSQKNPPPPASPAVSHPVPAAKSGQLPSESVPVVENCVRSSRKLSLTRLASSLRKRMSRRKSAGSTVSLSLRRRLSFRSNGRKNSNSLPDRGRCQADSPTPLAPSITVTDLKDSHQIIGAGLNTTSHHQYMSEMVENYLKAARVRFDEEQKRLAGLGAGGGAGRGESRNRRERISRSFSASSLPGGLCCMNGACEAPASAATNFLCPACFASQREMMASFSFPAPPIVLDRPPPKSSTLPSFASPSSPSSVGYRRTAPVNGVIRYLPPLHTQFCRSPHCQHYSNGHPALCQLCLSRSKT